MGSDSNVLIDAAEELRLLEYGQRLTLQARNVVAQGGVSSGRWLYDQAGIGAAQALGVAHTGIRPGAALIWSSWTQRIRPCWRATTTPW